MDFHEETNEDLKYYIDGIEKDNLILKEKSEGIGECSALETPVCRTHYFYSTIVQSRGCARNKLRIKRLIKFINVC